LTTEKDHTRLALGTGGRKQLFEAARVLKIETRFDDDREAIKRFLSERLQSSEARRSSR
jgi:hypothetical protein